MLQHCSAKYLLAIVSLVKHGTIEERQQALRDADLERYFSFIRFTTDNKDAAFEEALQHFGFKPAEVAIVDDRAVRGIRWGNTKGCLTFWLRKGKFSTETLPPTEHQAIHVIADLSPLLKLL